MGKEKITLIIFLLVALAQFAVPGSMILRNENTLENGEAFLFKAAPVDPYDPFRGRYVAMNLEAGNVTLKNASSFKRNDIVFCEVGRDSEGYAFFTGIHKKAPATDNYIKARVKYINRSVVTLDLPFKRFYMNEKKAPMAETAFRQSLRGADIKKGTYALVHVKKGFSVIRDIYIEGIPVDDYLERETKQTN